MAIQSSRPTKAESLLYKVVCTVGSLLNRECKTVPVEPTTPKPSPTTPPPAPMPVQPSSPNPSTPSEQMPPMSNTIQPLEINQSLLGQLPSVPLMLDNSSGSTKDMKFPSHTMQHVRSGGSSVLGTASSPASIQATEHGWRILGIQWYWWLISIFAVIFTVFATRPGGLKALLKLAKS